MFNERKLFVDRLKAHYKRVNRYLRYIFNGHFMIALLFIIIAGAIYYQQWIASLQADFPAGIIIAIVFGLLVTYHPLQLFLQEPDKVFLIVKEDRMHRYFRYGLIYNYVTQLYIIAIVIAVVAPLYHAQFLVNRYDFILLTAIILVLKGWNMLIHWMMLKVRNRAFRTLDHFVRIFMSMTIFYHVIVENYLIAAIYTGLFVVLFMNNYFLSRRQHGVAWDVLIENDAHRLSNFYRVVSMFAHVPQLQKRIRKRRFIATLINRFVPLKHEVTYNYLYRLTFIRSADYINMYVRLIVLGGLAIVFIPNGYLKIVFALLFVYMTNFQMVTLYHHYRTNIWLQLYPIETKDRENVFVDFLVQLTMIQTFIFALLFTVELDFSSFFLTLALGTLFNYVFNYMYVKKRIANG